VISQPSRRKRLERSECFRLLTRGKGTFYRIHAFKGITVNNKEDKLDELLDAIATGYNAQEPPNGALDRLKKRMRAETGRLADNDLDWLAAAGPGQLNNPEDKEKE
jgi:hypothetical protein